MSRFLVAAVALCLLAAPAFGQTPPPGGAIPEVAPAPPPPPPPPPPPAVERAPRHVRPVHVVPPPMAADDSPVVRAEAKDIGLYFKFGGLASLTHGNTSHNVGSLLFSQVGAKFVFSEHLMLPVWFGTGVRVNDNGDNDATTDWGIDLGAGIEYHFRIWRRISPFVGGGLGVSVEDASGDDNEIIGFGFGPTLGVEYYIGDRLSLTAQYMLKLQFDHYNRPVESARNTVFTFATLAGGAVNITYYF